KELSAEQIIYQMSTLSTPGLEFKTAPSESMYIIGSNSVNTQGELYILGIQSISKPENKKRKRQFDIIASVIIFLLSPILAFLGNSLSGIWNNCLQVLRGYKTWVGYVPSVSNSKLPKLPIAVVHPLSGLESIKWDAKITENCNLLYAKNYSPEEDFRILIKNINKIGSRAVIIKT